MKNKMLAINKKILLFLLAGAALMQAACKKDSGGGPVITGLRAISPAPNDSALTTAGPGQWVVIRGSHLSGATSVFFNGYSSSFNAALFSDTTMAVNIPSDMPFASLDTSKLNTVTVVTTHGTATYKFPIVPPPPVITALSNEYAQAGLQITITGNNFFFIQKVVFPGNIAVTSGITSNVSGTSIQVTVPAGITTSGTIQVVNRYGTGTSMLRFNDFVTGVMHNYDNVNNYSWGAGSSSSSTAYPNNWGTYGVMNASGVGGGDLGWWNGNRSINLNSVQWVPLGYMSQTLDYFALKFEINVTTPWTGGSLYIVKDYDWTYVARYEPWLNADGTTTNYTSKGWQTVVIPLSSFRTKANGLDGTGNPAATMAGLLGSSGAGGIDIMFVNSGTTAVASFEAAIDNIRVEKIK